MFSKLGTDNLIDIFDYLYGRELYYFILTDKNNNSIVHDKNVLRYIIKKLYSENTELASIIRNNHSWWCRIPRTRTRPAYIKPPQQCFGAGYLF